MYIIVIVKRELFQEKLLYIIIKTVNKAIIT